MAESDLGSVIAALENVSAFPTIPDRLQQGLLDELYLGRAMISSSGFTTEAAFHQDGTLSSGSVLDTEHLFYNGNSQGGIMGGALTAVSPDFTRASLGVPAMNYSVLLPRSVDFDEFAQVLYPFYPDETTRPLVLGLMQMLWDRGEPDGYAERMTGNPLPDTPRHQVLLDVAFGDHQVTDYQADVEARTDRRLRAQTDALQGPLAEHQRAVEPAGHQAVPLHRLGRVLLGHRPNPRKPARPGHGNRRRTAAVRKHSQPQRRRPALGAAQRARRAAARIRLLRRGHPQVGHLRTRPVLRGELHRAVGARRLRWPDEDPLIPPRVLVSVVGQLARRSNARGVEALR